MHAHALAQLALPIPLFFCRPGGGAHVAQAATPTAALMRFPMLLAAC